MIYCQARTTLKAKIAKNKNNNGLLRQDHFQRKKCKHIPNCKARRPSMQKEKNPSKQKKQKNP